MLQLSLAHEYELELLLIVDDDELDDDEELLPFIVVQLMPNDHLYSGLRVDLDLHVRMLKPSPHLNGWYMGAVGEQGNSSLYKYK